MRSRALILAGSCLALTGCGSLLESTVPAPQSYVLRLPQRTASAPAATVAGSLLVQRPEAGPGLESENIALLRSGQRFDFYAASRWAAPAPDVVENCWSTSCVIPACFPRYSTILRRMRRSTTCAAKCGASRRTTRSAANSPTVHVTLDCTFGRHRDRTLLASFTAQGSAPLPKTDSARSSRASNPRLPRHLPRWNARLPRRSAPNGPRQGPN